MDNSSLEQEIQQIQKQLEEKQKLLNQQKEQGQIKEMPHEKEVLKEVVKEKISAVPKSTEPPSTQTQQPVGQPSPLIEPPSYLSDQLRPKVQELVNMAFEKSIDSAVKELKHLNNPALEDAFHDALVDELYEEMINRGILKKIS